MRHYRETRPDLFPERETCAEYLFVQLPTKRAKVLTKGWFERILAENLGRPTANSRYGIPHGVYQDSFLAWAKDFPDHPRVRKHFNYAQAVKGNVRGTRERPSVVLEQEALLGLIARGLSVAQIAEQSGVTAFILQQNLKFYGLSVSPLPRRLQHLDEATIALYESLEPGFREAMEKIYTEPEAFEQRLYRVFVRLNEALWAVQDLANYQRYRREEGKSPKTHICWSLNRGELRLSELLLTVGVPHQRQVLIPGTRFTVDFFFPEEKLAVEVDGTQHRLPPFQARDREKEAVLTALGWKVLRFDAQEVLRSTDEVLLKVVKALALEP